MSYSDNRRRGFSPLDNYVNVYTNVASEANRAALYVDASAYNPITRLPQFDSPYHEDSVLRQINFTQKNEDFILTSYYGIDAGLSPTRRSQALHIGVDRTKFPETSNVLGDPNVHISYGPSIKMQELYTDIYGSPPPSMWDSNMVYDATRGIKAFEASHPSEAALDAIENLPTSDYWWSDKWGTWEALFGGRYHILNPMGDWQLLGGKGRGHGGGCFLADAKVLTKEGSKPIILIKPGDELEDGNKVEWLYALDYRGLLYTITLEDGTIIRATSEHPFYIVEEDKFIPIHKVVKLGLHLLHFDDKEVKITCIVASYFEGKVYNLKALKRTFYVEGFLVHNKGAGGGGGYVRNTPPKYYVDWSTDLSGYNDPLKGLGPGIVANLVAERIYNPAEYPVEQTYGLEPTLSTAFGLAGGEQSLAATLEWGNAPSMETSQAALRQLEFLVALNPWSRVGPAFLGGLGEQFYRGGNLQSAQGDQYTFDAMANTRFNWALQSRTYTGTQINLARYGYYMGQQATSPLALGWYAMQAASYTNPGFYGLRLWGWLGMGMIREEVSALLESTALQQAYKSNPAATMIAMDAH